MVKRVAITIGSVLGLLLVSAIVLILVVGTITEGSAGCSLQTGRAISASAHCFIGVESSKDTATIRTVRHTIIVAPTNVRVDGKVVGQISSATKAVNVRVTWTDIEILADGQPIGGQRAAMASKALSATR
ncbi:MAG: hypothetical protein ABIU95_11560 [Burkholderiales bacterium]